MGAIQPLEPRLFSQIEVSGHRGSCWLWNGVKDDHGYGKMSLNGHEERVHRIMYKLVNGEIPNGLFVLHRCDTPACVNPDHLFVGTQKDNMQDCIKKGRFNAKGPTAEQSGTAKLTQREVNHIRFFYDMGATQTEIAEEYEVSISTISLIVRERTWKHSLVE